LAGCLRQKDNIEQRLLQFAHAVRQGRFTIRSYDALSQFCAPPMLIGAPYQGEIACVVFFLSIRVFCWPLCPAGDAAGRRASVETADPGLLLTDVW
jgi:hypothetical protein